MTLLKLENLTKRFGSVDVVDSVDLDVNEGEIVGFLGPNGAGKTTTMKMVAGLLKPDKGRILILDHDLDENPVFCKQKTGYVPDRPWLFEKLTGMEYLQFIAGLYNQPGEIFLDSAVGYLDYFDLTSWQNNLIESYSHGMRQKLVMTSVMMLNQPLLIIDEPMVGLDPKSARIVKELFKQGASEGKAIFLSTHSLEIAEELCHRIAIINKGKLLKVGDIETLRHEAGKDHTGQLEDIFLELTGSRDLQQIIKALKKTP